MDHAVCHKLDAMGLLHYFDFVNLFLFLCLRLSELGCGLRQEVLQFVRLSLVLCEGELVVLEHLAGCVAVGFGSDDFHGGAHFHRRGALV